MSSPELPAKHWLDEAPGVPIENREKLEAALPNLYDPTKKFNYEECVFLTIQQSPMLVNSAVDLEIRRLAVTDAVWKYLPEVRLVLTVSQNLTRNNMNEKNTPSDYGRPMMRAALHGNIPNPMRSYFEHKVQGMLLNLAITTHRKAIGEAIMHIAKGYLTLQAQRDILAAQQEAVPVKKELSDYWRQVEEVEGRQGAQVNIARQGERETDLKVEQTVMREVMDRTRLKILAGVDPNQKFEVDTSNSDDILRGFDGTKMKWEDRWEQTEDDLLLRAQIKLADYNIMVAWAQYMPNMSMAINQSPPAGQAQPPNGREDQFLHLNFDFPLLDWGARYRGVQTARMKKAQAFQDMARKRTEFSNKWLEAEQNTALARNEYKLQQTRFETAEMEYKEAEIAYNEGTIEYPIVAKRREDMIEAKVRMIRADLELKLAEVEWMHLANLLGERFLGPPAKDII